MAGVTARLVRPEDWTTWRDLRLRALRDSPSAFGSTYEREARFDEADWRSRTGSENAVSVIAWDGATAVAMGGGFQDLPGLLHVVAMWTDPARRGLGAGTAVLCAVEAWARERGLGLHLDVNLANPRARALYEHHGYVGTGETRPLREGSTETVEHMVLRR